jgi:cyanuric acid amidohydrolase
LSGVKLYTVPTSGPDDTTALRVIESDGHDKDSIIAVIGKTEGNGCVNDFSRSLAARAWEDALTPETVTVFSGGTEGVLSPHVNILVKEDPVRPFTTDSPLSDRGLVSIAGQTPDILPQHIGRKEQVDAVAAKVAELLQNLEVETEDVHLVLVKCPLLTSTTIQESRDAGRPTVCSDTYESMGRSRSASSLGIAVALNEIDSDTAYDALVGKKEAWSERASASAGAEIRSCHVVVVAESKHASNNLRAVHTHMSDALDLRSVQQECNKIRGEGGRIRQIFVKSESSPDGKIRGFRHTMLTDSDINPTRHARAAVGALMGSVKGDGAVYVSGGAEHQGPPGGGSVTIIYEVSHNR